MQFVLAWLGCSALQKGPLWWAAHHRQHHRYSDTPDDPHSPHVTSFWWAHVGWILAEDHVETPWECIQDWALSGTALAGPQPLGARLVLAVVCSSRRDRRLPATGAIWPGWTSLVWGFVISTVLTYHATFAINSLSHLFGSAATPPTTTAATTSFLALITLGEGWHNNHHHYQSSANQGFFWWEIDISYTTLRLLGCRAGLGLAQAGRQGAGLPQHGCDPQARGRFHEGSELRDTNSRARPGA